MGRIYKIKNKTGIKWGIDYIDPVGQRIRKIISSYRDVAENALKKIEIQIAENKYLDVNRFEPILFEDFATKFFETHILLENRSVRNQKYLLTGLVRCFKGKYLHEITNLDIKRHMSTRLKHVKPSTVNSDITMLKSMYNRANEWQILKGYNPLKDIKKLKENNERCRWLTVEEQQCLLFNCEGVTKMIVLIALKTGLRWSEIINLKWKPSPCSNYVDFSNDTIFVHESLAKSKKSRYVPLSKMVKQGLMDYPQRVESGYIFINPKTGKLYDNIKRSFNTALKKAGINDFRFHDCRHCFAVDLKRKGVDLCVIQKLLGHSSPKMTQRYAHVGDELLKSAIQELDEPDFALNGRNLTDCITVL